MTVHMSFRSDLLSAIMIIYRDGIPAKYSISVPGDSLGEPDMSQSDKETNDNGIMTDKAALIKNIKEYFESEDIKYKFEDDEKQPRYIVGAMGDDLPILVIINIADESISFACPLNLKASPDNYQKVVWELNKINKGLLFGAFYLDPEDGFIVYEYGLLYNQTKFSKDFFLGHLHMIFSTVDEFDGKLKALAETVSREEYRSMYF